ncbi:MAG: CHASE domain-containing protein [Verrucomicrobiae bacterium]
MALLLLAGGAFTWWTVVQTDISMRGELLREVQVVAQGINRTGVQQLKGTAADLQNPAYLRIKEQLATVRTSNPLCRFLYLMDRRPNGEIVFFVDSEPAGAKDCSPPGQVYSEASEACRRVFVTRVAEVDGPTTDRWGTWVTGLIPIHGREAGSVALGDSRDVLAVLGMDIEASTWNRALVRASVAPALLTLLLASILLLRSLLLARRSGMEGMHPNWMNHIEPALAAAAGLALTFFSAWLIHERAVAERRQEFKHLAANRTEAVAESLRELRDTELVSIARFYESSEKVTSEEFECFTRDLVNKPAVKTWAWIPAVPAAEKPRFEADARAAELAGFEIWQKGERGSRTPAAGREVYYPVFHMAPLAGNQLLAGYDVGSEPQCLVALEEAARSGLPVAMVAQEAGLLIAQPVFTAGEPKRLRGFALADLRLENLLRTDFHDGQELMELSLLRNAASPERLATSWSASAPPKIELSDMRAVFAFGKVFAVTAHAGPKFLPIHPEREALVTLLSGLVLSALLAVAVRFLLRRREQMVQLVAERELLARAIEQAAEAIFITNAKGQIQYVNPAFVSMTGYSREEAIGQNPRILKSGIHDASFYREMWKALLGGKTWQGNLVNRKKDGTHFTEESTISPMHDATGKIVSFVAVKRDISEELSLQSQLIQSQKMESVGKLAGGVAHDFNNMLCVILGHTELALEALDPSHPLFDDLQAIRNSAQRSAGLTQQLLAFARQQTIAPQVMDLNETIGGMIKMLSHLIGEDVRLDILPADGLWPVKMDPTQVDQIVINLCVNARDAIADVGAITIETRNKTLDEDYCANRIGAVPGEYVQISVSDSGCGMDKPTLSHIFEPFFTTKEIGKGTGLGLATVYGIVKQNHGVINAYSEPEHGTTFTVSLPRHRGEAEPPNPEPKVPERGRETILLVEDEPAILNMTKEVLERLEYTVLAASSPAEAIGLAESHPGAINLLITDVIMPEMNGKDLGKKLLDLSPSLKCLFMSGYTANVLSPHGVLNPDVHFIQKPFSMGELSAKVREALASR